MSKRKKQTVAGLAKEVELLWRARKTCAENLAQEACHRGELSKRVDALDARISVLEGQREAVKDIPPVAPQPEPPRPPRRQMGGSEMPVYCFAPCKHRRKTNTCRLVGGCCFDPRKPSAPADARCGMDRAVAEESGR